MAGPARDRWAEWLLARRFGGDADRREAFLGALIPWRDRVLENAGVGEGDTLLDVGAGDGLIAFGALDLVGRNGRVIFSDVSQDLLDHSRTLAEETGVLGRCGFLLAPADDLSAVEDGSVDVVTTRSVLIYVPDKRRAFEEFHRVLKPGGTLSIFEPINSFTHPEPPQLFSGYDVTPVADLADKVKTAYGLRQSLDDDPMLNFDERDLFELAERAGFEEVHLNYEARVTPGSADEVLDWETRLRSAPNPLSPTLEEAMNEALTPGEIERFTTQLRPLVEQDRRIGRDAVSYLWAVK